MLRLLVASGCLVVGLVGAPVRGGDPAPVPNPDFTAGTDRPEGWTLPRGQGRWADRSVLEVTGSGREESAAWESAPVALEPGQLYHFTARVRCLEGSAGVISGPSCANRDHRITAGDWQEIGHVFRAPEEGGNGAIRLGVWNSRGTVQFDRVALEPAVAVHRGAAGLVLGEGESVREGIYRFSGRFGFEGSNAHRTLLRATAGFNSDRWCFWGRGEVVYRFGVPGRSFRTGRIRVGVNYHTRGTGLVEASRDGQTWEPAGRIEAVGTRDAEVPASLLPAEALFVRLRADGPESTFQVNDVDFEGTLGGAGSTPDLIGTTAFADVTAASPGFEVVGATQGVDPPSGRTVLRIRLRNRENNPIELSLRGAITSEAGARSALTAGPGVAVPTGETREVEIVLPDRPSGTSRLGLELAAKDGAKLSLAMTLRVPYLERTDYGRALAGVSGPVAVWWCEAAQKVGRDRPAPTEAGASVELAAARNDWQAAQVVVRPSRDLAGLSSTASDLSGPGGATIPATAVRFLRVAYHLVETPTDATGMRGWWPDALPPLDRPIGVTAGTNQPLWVLVHVPEGAAAGDYRGTIRLRAEGWSAEIPLGLHVWDFALPAENHVETAFGFTPELAFRYHNVRTEADRRTLLDLYFRSFAEHRISPYNPAPLDPIGVRFHADAKPPRAEVDFTRFDSAMARAFEEYHFTNFMLHVPGMGGGTFHSRTEPSLAGFGEATPEYRALFASYLGQVQEHLKTRGWLEKAYVYWFDEPEPKDYDFVRAGMKRLEEQAPGIPRMLTEEPSEALAGIADIWCPLTPSFDPAEAAQCRARGERFWWYVCTGPKAPYATLFIDHPATELRVWLWQTWQRGIAGNLVWATNWWTSPTAFPVGFQNPYDDPMSYTSGYGLPKGTRAHWGNGDGRFLYPPEAAAVPGRNSGRPILEPPVSSLRWEMLREGIEDFEFLWLLRERLERKRGGLDPATVRRYEALLEVPPEITADLTTFADDPAPLDARRGEVARAIEELGR